MTKFEIPKFSNFSRPLLIPTSIPCQTLSTMDPFGTNLDYHLRRILGHRDKIPKKLNMHITNIVSKSYLKVTSAGKLFFATLYSH